MAYQVKEIFHTLQGEGAHTGRSAVFCRFSGCNLWSGREDGRTDAVCWFCDTDFVGTDGPGGGRFDHAADLAAAVATCWRAAVADSGDLLPYVVCTGGEPLLQLDTPLIAALHDQGFQIAVETNGTLVVPKGVDWVCVSPKAGAPLRQTHGDELKVVWPQQGLDLKRLARLPFTHYFLQPMDGPQAAADVVACVAYCRTHPQWRLSLQTHKLIGIP